MVRKWFFNENDDENENSMMIMEKKKYITPECEVIELEGIVYMSATSFEESLDDEILEGGGSDMGSNRHRGEWGNLWSDWGEK